MKLYKITLYISFFLFILFALFFLGLKERIGYIDNIELNLYETLNINSINTNDITYSIYTNYNALLNYVESNKNITNYYYTFKIGYYSKLFRNSDIYNVFPKNIEFIRNNNFFINKISMNKSGSPFGYFISDRIISNVSNSNIYYSLKLKFNFIIYCFVGIILVLILLKNIKFVYYYFYFFVKKIVSFLKETNSYFLIIFLSFLILPNIMYILFYNFFDHTNYENRELINRPKFIISNINNYTKEYYSYYNDHLAFKNELVKLKNLIDIKIFYNIVSSHRRLLGKDKWLFYDSVYSSKKLRKLDDKELLELKNLMLSFVNKLKKENIDFILLICPKKEFVYTEYLPKYFRLRNYDYITEQFIQYMKDSGVKIIYLKGELLKYKSKYQLYYKYDFHWNKLGAYIGYSEIMKSLSLPYDNLDELTILSNNIKNYKGTLFSQYNDISRGLGLSRNRVFTDDYIFDISNYYTNSLSYYITNEIDWATFDTYSYSNFNNKRLFIVRDSYFAYIRDYISPVFSNISFVHFNNFFTNGFKKESKPDIFIIEYLDLASYDMISFIKTLNNIELGDIYLYNK